jgi:hypothetical protein
MLLWGIALLAAIASKHTHRGKLTSDSQDIARLNKMLKTLSTLESTLVKRKAQRSSPPPLPTPSPPASFNGIATLWPTTGGNGLAWTRIVLPTPVLPSSAPTVKPTTPQAVRQFPSGLRPKPQAAVENNRLFAVPQMRVRHNVHDETSEWKGEQHSGGGDCDFESFCGWGHSSWSLGEGRVFGSIRQSFAWAVTTSLPLYAVLTTPALEDKTSVTFDFKVAIACEKSHQDSDALETKIAIAARRDGHTQHPELKLKQTTLALQVMGAHISCSETFCPTSCRCGKLGFRCDEMLSNQPCQASLWTTLWHYHGSPSDQSWHKAEVSLAHLAKDHWVDRLRFIATAPENSMMIDTRVAAVHFSSSDRQDQAVRAPTPRPSLCIDRFDC